MNKVDLSEYPADELFVLMRQYIDDMLDASYQYSNNMDYFESGDITSKTLDRSGDALQSARDRLEGMIYYLIMDGAT